VLTPRRRKPHELSNYYPNSGPKLPLTSTTSLCSASFLRCQRDTARICCWAPAAVDRCILPARCSATNERGRTAHLRPASPRSHLQRTHQPPLAPGSGKSTVQDGRARVQGNSWNCAVIPESTGSCRRSAWSTFPPPCSDQSSARTVRETVYRRRPGLPGRRTHHLEQPAGQRDICPVSVNLLSASKTFLFQASFTDIIIDPR